MKWRSKELPRSEMFWGAALWGSGLVTILTTVGILAILSTETVSFFREVSFAQFFLDTLWTPLFAEQHFGIWPLISGTLLTTSIAMCVAFPLGFLAGIYMSEFAKPRIRQTIKPMLEVLAGVPTIVYGYFALVALTPFLRKIIPSLSGFNALSAGIMVGIMIIPLLSSLIEDALYAVPRVIREGAYALGADRLRVTFKVVVPSAFSGIMASILLAISRAVGETMIVTIAAGLQPRLTFDPRVPIGTMTSYIAQISQGDTPTGTLAYKTIFVVGATLFVITFVMNVIGQRMARRFREKV